MGDPFCTFKMSKKMTETTGIIVRKFSTILMGRISYRQLVRTFLERKKNKNSPYGPLRKRSNVTVPQAYELPMKFKFQVLLIKFRFGLFVSRSICGIFTTCGLCFFIFYKSNPYLMYPGMALSEFV